VIDKLRPDVLSVLDAVPSGASLAVGGFGSSGRPDMLLDALCDLDRRDLHLIVNNVGSDFTGVGRMLAEGRIRRFREETRGRRIEIAREAEHKFRRKVSWGVTCADVTEMFTTLSVPVMTRLRQPERRVLDTLVDAGVARSRSDALAWCVRLTGENSDAWLSRLRAALRRVEEVRDQGPAST